MVGGGRGSIVIKMNVSMFLQHFNQLILFYLEQYFQYWSKYIENIDNI